MSTNEHTTISWLHNGTLLNRYPQTVASPEHRRRLQHVHNTAHGLIRATLTVACVAVEAGQPTIGSRVDRDSIGWRRVEVDSANLGNPAVLRRAIGQTSLTLEDYKLVTDGLSDGNEATQLLLATIAEAGFRDPVRMLGACPVLSKTEGPSERTTSPPERPDLPVGDLEAAFTMLPGAMDFPGLPAIS